MHHEKGTGFSLHQCKILFVLHLSPLGFLLFITYFSFLWATTIYKNYTMDNLTYSVLAGLALLLIFLFVIKEIRKYQRYKKMLDMEVEVQFHESEDAYDHMRRGTVMLHLYRSEEHI